LRPAGMDDDDSLLSGASTAGEVAHNYSTSRRVLQQGYVSKASRHLGRWRQRWLVLSAETGRYFVCTFRKGAGACTERLALDGATVVTCAASDPACPRGGRHCFAVALANLSVFYFSSPDERVSQSWVAAISACIAVGYGRADVQSSRGPSVESVVLARRVAQWRGLCESNASLGRLSVAAELRTAARSLAHALRRISHAALWRATARGAATRLESCAARAVFKALASHRLSRNTAAALLARAFASWQHASLAAAARAWGCSAAALAARRRGLALASGVRLGAALRRWRTAAAVAERSRVEEAGRRATAARHLPLGGAARGWLSWRFHHAEAGRTARLAGSVARARLGGSFARLQQQWRSAGREMQQAALARLQAELASARDALAGAERAALERERVLVDEQNAARVEAEKERRVSWLQAVAARRMQRSHLAWGWAGWSAAHGEEQRRRRLLRLASARRPLLATGAAFGRMRDDRNAEVARRKGCAAQRQRTHAALLVWRGAVRMRRGLLGAGKALRALHCRRALGGWWEGVQDQRSARLDLSVAGDAWRSLSLRRVLCRWRGHAAAAASLEARGCECAARSVERGLGRGLSALRGHALRASQRGRARRAAALAFRSSALAASLGAWRRRVAAAEALRARCNSARRAHRPGVCGARRAFGLLAAHGRLFTAGRARLRDGLSGASLRRAIGVWRGAAAATRALRRARVRNVALASELAQLSGAVQLLAIEARLSELAAAEAELLAELDVGVLREQLGLDDGEGAGGVAEGEEEEDELGGRVPRVRVVRLFQAELDAVRHEGHTLLGLIEARFPLDGEGSPTKQADGEAGYTSFGEKEDDDAYRPFGTPERAAAD